MDTTEITSLIQPKEPKKLSIISFSGDFDKLVATFTLATGAAATGYEVNIFFTFWGLDAIKEKTWRIFIGSMEETDLGRGSCALFQKNHQMQNSPLPTSSSRSLRRMKDQFEPVSAT